MHIQIQSMKDNLEVGNIFAFIKALVGLNVGYIKMKWI